MLVAIFAALVALVIVWSGDLPRDIALSLFLGALVLIFGRPFRRRGPDQ